MSDTDARDELLLTSTLLLSGRCGKGLPVTDRDIEDAVTTADRLIRRVDKFAAAVVTVAGHDTLPDYALDYLRVLVKEGPLLPSSYWPHPTDDQSNARRVLLKAGLGAWDGERFAATEKGKEMLGEQP